MCSLSAGGADPQLSLKGCVGLPRRRGGGRGAAGAQGRLRSRVTPAGSGDEADVLRGSWGLVTPGVSIAVLPLDQHWLAFVRKEVHTLSPECMS